MNNQPSPLCSLATISGTWPILRIRDLCDRFFKVVCLSILVSASAHAMQNNAHLGEQLHTAARAGNHIEIERLIKLGAPVDYVDNDHGTALLYATSHGHLNCAQILIAARAQVNHQDINGITALMCAVFANNQPACKLLVDAMLRIPNQEQKAQITTLLGIAKTQKKLCPSRLDAYLRKQLKIAWLATVYEDNKKNFPSSIAYQELNRIKASNHMQISRCQKQIEALIEKYNY